MEAKAITKRNFENPNCPSEEEKSRPARAPFIFIIESSRMSFVVNWVALCFVGADYYAATCSARGVSEHGSVQTTRWARCARGWGESRSRRGKTTDIMWILFRRQLLGTRAGRHGFCPPPPHRRNCVSIPIVKLNKTTYVSKLYAFIYSTDQQLNYHNL